MNELLKLELEKVGWEDLYGRWVDWGNSRTGSNGDRQIRSTVFSDVFSDSRPSLRINLHSGSWYCYKTQRGGGYCQFLSWIHANEEDERGRLVPVPIDEIERELIQEMGISNPVNKEWLEACRENLHNNLSIQAHLHFLGKFWDWEIAYQLGIGYDEESDKIIFPCYDRNGTLINARAYHCGGTPKFVWVARSLGGNFLWPRCAVNDPIIWIVEGEPDALTLRSYGIPACSGTLGSGCPVPPGEWYYRKIIYLCFDVDEAGRAATQAAGDWTVRNAHSVGVVDLPEWTGRPDNADISDYVSALRAGGASYSDIQQALVALQIGARQLSRPDDILDADPRDVSFTDATLSGAFGEKLRFTARVVAVNDSKFNVPNVFTVRCPGEGHRYCGRCPMEGTMSQQITHRPINEQTLAMIDVSEKIVDLVIKDIVGVPLQCPDFRVEKETISTIQDASLGPAVDADDATELRCHSYIHIPDGAPAIEASREYVFTGFQRTSPKTQMKVLHIDSMEDSETRVDQFMMSTQIYDELRMFQPRTDQSVWSKLVDVAEDYANAITGIRGRLDLHIAYRTVWHSILRFKCGSELVDRGWLECLVMGDTACGKSEAFKRMRDWLGFGVLVDCKNQSAAGILGGATQIQATGAWYITPGVYPQNDRRLIGFDEFNTRLDKTSLIENLASVRSDGVVTITKVAKAVFKARVRSIWMANPGQGRLLSELGGTGVELIPRLVQQPEDIRRFDFALIVAQEDVPVDSIQTTQGLASAQYPQDASRNLLLWAWSRKEDQVEFTEDAAKAVIILAKIMVNIYSDRIPLVERSEQRKRIAKVAASVAAQCFSCSEDGEKVIVDVEHVTTAGQLFVLWYDKPAMGYKVYSDRSKMDNEIRDEPAVRNFFNETLKPNGPEAARQLLQIHQIGDRMLQQLMPVPMMFAHALIPNFLGWRMIRPVNGGRGSNYEITPAGVCWLKNYLGIV